MIRLLFITRRFEQGGAERQLVELLRGLDKTRFSIAVAPFYEGGRLYEDVARIQGIQVVALRKRHRWDVIRFLWRLWWVVHGFRPQLIYGYMGVANELGLLMGRLSGAKVIWGVRASNMDLSHYDWLSRLSFRLERLLSRFVDLIIVNSKSGRDYRASHGFPENKMLVIPNGIDTGRFRPDPRARQRLRKEWGLSETETLIGLVARLDPMKDHHTFLAAVKLMSAKCSNARFVCIGDGPSSYRATVLAFAGKLGVKQQVIWAGSRSDLPDVYNALDILTLCSAFGEGFPNVVGEAMACGIPCVVTDVGDSARIVDGTGIVVPTKNPQALSEGWVAMIERVKKGKRVLANKVRRRIANEFCQELLTERTTKALTALV